MHLSSAEGVLALPPDDAVATRLSESYALVAWEETRGKCLLLVGDLYWTESAVQFVSDYLV